MMADAERAGARSPFLVLAHHRSGSNFLNDLLQTHPRLECLNEPLSMHAPFFLEHDLEPWPAAAFDPVRLHPSLAADAELVSYLQALRTYLYASRAERVIGFKETVLFGQLGWVQRWLPGLKVIFLWRDPRAVVSSVLRSGLMGFWRYEELVPPAFARLFPAACLPTAVAGSPAGLAAMSVVVRGELARRSLACFDHLVLRLENVLHEPAAAIGALTGFLDVEPHPNPLGFLHRRRSASRGGMFSSFRDPAEVMLRWQHHLDARELAAVEQVLHAAHWRDPEQWSVVTDDLGADQAVC